MADDGDAPALARDAETTLALAHALRTPLTSLALGLGLLDDGVLGALNEGQRDVVHTLVGEVARLTLLAERHLDTGRLGAYAGPVERVRVDLAALVRRAAAPIEQQARDRGVRLVLALAARIEVVVDPVKLAWVAVSLMGNALRYSPPGADIRVSLAAAEGSRGRGRARGHGSRPRARARGGGAHLRSRRGPRPLPGARDRRGPRRAHRGDDDARARLHVHHHAARGDLWTGGLCMTKKGDVRVLVDRRRGEHPQDAPRLPGGRRLPGDARAHGRGGRGRGQALAARPGAGRSAPRRAWTASPSPARSRRRRPPRRW